MGCCCSSDKRKRDPEPKIDSRTLLGSPDTRSPLHTTHRTSPASSIASSTDSEKNYKPPEVTKRESSFEAYRRSGSGSGSQSVMRRGWLKKRGHMVHSWRTRHFVLDQTQIQYYEKALEFPPYGENLKGQIRLLGATVDLIGGNDGTDKYKIHLVGRQGEKDLLLEASEEHVAVDWHRAISDVIRNCNIESINRGERLPEIERWYIQQNEQHQAGVDYLAQGHLFRKHGHSKTQEAAQIDPCYISTSKDSTSLVWQHVSSTEAGSSNVTKQGHPHSLPFSDIVDVVVDVETIAARKDQLLSSSSAMFSIITKSHALDLEAQSHDQRDRWVSALRSVINFLAIPPPSAERVPRRRSNN